MQKKPKPKTKLTRLTEALKQIEQMSDPGDPFIAIVRMKQIATEALKK